jgi:hypothetical protein
MNLKEYYKELLSEAYAARTVRLDASRAKARKAAKGQTYQGNPNRSAALDAAERDYSTAYEGRRRSMDRRVPPWGADIVRGAAVSLASRPSDRAAAEKEAMARFSSRGQAGGSPELRAAALAGRRPSGPNLRTLISKAGQMQGGS